MDIIEKIQDAQTMQQLDSLRNEIHVAAMYNEIDFKFVKRVFLEKKAELELLREKNWRVRNE